MEQNKILLQGKFSISSKPGKVYVVTLTNQFLKFQDVNWGRDNGAEGVIDLRDVIGCHINAGENKQGRSTSCTCKNSSVVVDRTECLLSVYFCPKKKKNSLSRSYQRRHCTLTLGLSQYSDYSSNKTVCEKWRKTILSLSTENNNDITFNRDIESCEVPLPRKLLVLINPFSGPGKALQIFQNGVSHMLEEADISFKMIVTEHAGHATDVMRSLDLSAWYGVVIVSGDGLIYEVINGLMSRSDWETAISFPIGCIPGGSGNALCLNINYLAGEPVDLNPILHSTFVLIKHRVIPMDLVLVQTQKAQLFSFLSVTWGLIADIDFESERMRVLGASRFTLYFIKRVLMVSKNSELDAPSSYVEYEESTQATENEAAEAVPEVDNSNQIVILPSMHNADKESELGTQACTLNEPSESESRPKKRKKISFDDLQRMQYEVLCCQKTHIGLKNVKIQKDIERSELETENLKLQNAKLTHEIELLKQNLAQNENALLALQALSDE